MKNADDRRKGWPPTLHVLWIVPAAAALLAMIVPKPAAVYGLPQQANENFVRVQAQCTGNGRLGRVSVDPWTLVVSIPEPGRDEDVVWILENGPDPSVQDADSIVIQPKDVGEWPFGLTRAGTRGRGPNARGVLRMSNRLRARGQRAIERDVEIGDRFWYNVIVFCTEADSVYTVAIDPDIEGGGP